MLLKREQTNKDRLKTSWNSLFSFLLDYVGSRPFVFSQPSCLFPTTHQGSGKAMTSLRASVNLSRANQGSLQQQQVTGISCPSKTTNNKLPLKSDMLRFTFVLRCLSKVCFQMPYSDMTSAAVTRGPSCIFLI